ncbi:MAG TPA: hypothetical protein PKO15_03205 [Fibrobacteria bacterium]|nr:hypothetical protein [Fibrobacteria bacterium]HOX51991.1 hypothetical protein [Fibrobacteria bacterium]
MHGSSVWDHLADAAGVVLAILLLGMQTFTNRPHRRFVLVLLMALCVFPLAVLASANHTPIADWAGVQVYGGLVVGSVVGQLGSVVAMVVLTVKRRRP